MGISIKIVLRLATPQLAAAGKVGQFVSRFNALEALTPAGAAYWSDPPTENTMATVETWLPEPSDPSAAVAVAASICPKPLEACRVAAVGFARQDVVFLSTNLSGRCGSIEFLTRDRVSDLGKYDLLILNAASPDVVKREGKRFRAIYDTGIPAIVIGSRISSKLLQYGCDIGGWDFILKPFDIEEVVWRAVNLLARRPVHTVPVIEETIVEETADPAAALLVETEAEAEPTHRAAQTTPLACPKCCGKGCRPSMPVGLRDHLSRLVFLGPYRCMACRTRFFRFTWPWAGPWRTRFEKDVVRRNGTYSITSF